MYITKIAKSISSNRYQVQPGTQERRKTQLQNEY